MINATGYDLICLSIVFSDITGYTVRVLKIVLINVLLNVLRLLLKVGY